MCNRKARCVGYCPVTTRHQAQAEKANGSPCTSVRLLNAKAQESSRPSFVFFSINCVPLGVIYPPPEFPV